MAEEITELTPWAGSGLNLSGRAQEQGPSITSPVYQPSGIQIEGGLSFGFARPKLGEKIITDTYEKWGPSAPSVIAYAIVDEITSQKGSENLMSVKSLLDGTAPYFDLKPETKNLSPEERKLTINDIVKELSNAEDRSIMEQLYLESPRVFTSLTGGYLGAKTGAKIARGLVARGGVTGRAGAYAAGPIVLGTTLFGSLAGSEMGPLVRDTVLGAPDPYTPDSRMNVVLGSAAADALEGLGALGLLQKSMGKAGKADLGLDAAALMLGIKDVADNPNIPKSLKFLRGFENLFGRPAVLATTAPKSTYGAEAALGATQIAAAGAAEIAHPGDPFVRGAAQIGAPVGLSTAYGLSPVRMILSTVWRSLKPAFSKKEATQNALELAIPKYEKAVQDNPEANPADFNLRLNDKGEYELINEPKFRERIVNIGRAFSEGRKNKAAQLLVDSFYSDLADEKPEVIEKKLDELVASFRRGETKALFQEPSFARIRKMLERQGIDFSSQARLTLSSGEKATEDEIEGVLNLMTAGLAADNREGYLLASVLSQKLYEADIAEQITTRAARVLDAYKRVVGSNEMDADMAAEALFKAIEPLIESTSATATKLYNNISNHRILFGEDVPTIVKSLDENAELLPTDPRVVSMLPSPLQKAINYVEDIRRDHQVFSTSGTPTFSEFFRGDVGLQKAQRRFEGLLDRASGPAVDRYNDFISKIDLDSENATKQINDFVLRQYGGKSGSKGEAAKQTKQLLEAQRDLLLEEKAAQLRAEQLVKEYSDSPVGGIDTKTIKEFRSELLSFSRQEGISSQQRKQAHTLANIFERQLLDEAATRDIPKEDALEQMAARSAANAYYRARQNIFNDGIFSQMNRPSAQGSDQAVEVLRDKVKDLRTPTLRLIEDMQRAARFTLDPINTPSIRKGALAAQNDVDLLPYEQPILAGMVKPTDMPPSADALEHRILSEIETLIVKNQQIPGTKREVLDPRSVDDVVAESGSLGLKTAERTAIQDVLNRSQNNGLDLLPNLKSKLMDLLETGEDFAEFRKNIASDNKKYADQNLWYAMASGGKYADFNEIMKKAYSSRNRSSYGLRPIYDNLMKPISQMNARARENPREFLEALKEEKLLPGLEDVNVENLSDETVAEFLEQASESAKSGLRSLIVDYAKAAAGKNTPRGLNFSALRTHLFDPPKLPSSAVNMPSLVDWMRQNRLMTTDQANNLKNSIDRFVSLEAEIAKDFPDLQQTNSPLKRGVVSIFGSAVGGSAHRMMQQATGGLLGGTGSLTATGIGAETARNVLINARAASVQDGLIKLMQDEPAEIARFISLARKAANPNAKVTAGDVRTFLNILTQMQAISVPKGFTIRVGAEEPTRERKPLMPTEEIRDFVDPYGVGTYPDKRKSYSPGGMEAKRPQANVTPYYGAPVAPGGMGAPRASNQTSPTSLADRARLAAAFPNDPILKLMG